MNGIDGKTGGKDIFREYLKQNSQKVDEENHLMHPAVSRKTTMPIGSNAKQLEI